MHNAWQIEFKRDIPIQVFSLFLKAVRKARTAFGVTYTETRKAISIEYTEKKRLIRDLSGLGQITCKALLERKSSQVMPPKLNRFNVGLFNKIKKQKRDAALQENTKLMNCVANESRKLKSIQMKLKRLQVKVSNNYVTDFYFIY